MYFLSYQTQDIQTEPPPRSNFADTVNQWVIYDAYVSYEYAKELQDEKDRARSKTDTSNQTIKRLLGNSASENINITWFIIDCP